MSNEDNLKHQLEKLSWEPWLRRPFGAFILSLYHQGVKPKYFKQIGIKGCELKIIFYSNGIWYLSQDYMAKAADSFLPYLKYHDIFDITKKLATFHQTSRKKILRLVDQSGPMEEKLKVILEILAKSTTFIWVAHVLERLYLQKARQLVPKYITGDVEKFIGDASYPKKKTAYSKMEDLIRRGVNSAVIVKKYGWVRSRDYDSQPFKVSDIAKFKKGLKPTKKYQRVLVPKPLKKLFAEMQELVFYRTARTDTFFELLFLARPILKSAAEKYGIDFKELENYTIHSLIVGKPKRYNKNFSFAYLNNKFIYSNKPIIKIKVSRAVNLIKGMVAFPGRAQGRAKVVFKVGELDKVKNGDILVAPMTFPSFIMAMQRAAAFVTDEGGVTCHAAIIARELKKPCIIGTKIATQVLKDWDLVEVDANQGIVRKLNK